MARRRKAPEQPVTRQVAPGELDKPDPALSRYELRKAGKLIKRDARTWHH